MPSTRLLNGLPHNLIQSYMSTLCYHKKGYMADWIYNGTKLLAVNEVVIDIMNDNITPNEMNIMPLLFYVRPLKDIISNTLTANKFDTNFITSAHIYIEVKDFDSRTIYCRTEVMDINGKLYTSKITEEKVYEPFFDVFNEIGSNGIRNRIMKFMSKWL